MTIALVFSSARGAFLRINGGRMAGSMPVGDIRRVSVKCLWYEALVCYSLHSR